MRRTVRIGLVLVGLTLAGGLFLLEDFITHGVSTRRRPLAVEAFVARRLRHLAIPRAARKRFNPLARTQEGLAQARVHFADHCASCHGNDGKGETPIGQGLYPKAPDMRLAETQGLSDGELFSIIQNGVRFTGMPAWGSGSAEDEKDSWNLVHFIRHLPEQTPEEVEEMRQMNPKTPEDLREEDEIRKFLEGGEDASTNLPVKH